MSDFEHVERHHTGDCAIECPLCAVEELDRLAVLGKRDAIAEPDTFFVAPDPLGRPALWRLDDADEPQIVTRRDEWSDPGAWELLEMGVRLALAVAG